MHLRKTETVRRTYHHHYFPFILQILKLIVASSPFYFLVFIAAGSITRGQLGLAILIVTFLFGLTLAYISFIYWADRLVITNLRVLHFDWKLLNLSSENEVELRDLQDVSVKGRGILSFIPFLDYGTISMETSASTPSVIFKDAPSPDKIKAFIYEIA